MKILDIIKKYKAAILDPERDFTERVFLIYSLISEIGVFICLIGDIIMKEYIEEIYTLILIIVTVMLVTVICLIKDRLKVAIYVLIFSLVFLIIPALYFFGGGIEGGGVLWIIFAFMYIGLLLSGKMRTVMFGLLFAVSLACYFLGYFHPELVSPHSWRMYFVDSFISLFVVGMICFVMTWVQRQLFQAENERAKKETERAEELTRSQNRFFSSMSHEIRTPINSILGLNELILRDQSTSDEIVKDATGIQGAGKMLLALINDILDFSKIEAGSMDIVPVDYRVGDLFSEVVNMIWQRASEKGLELRVSIDPDVPTVLYGDEVRIKQVIVNLLNNAVKYTKEGFIDLHVESSALEEDKVLLSISVADTGMGIKKEALPYLFDAFKRVDEEKNRHIEGTGLGLSIVKQLVDLMDGTITVNSVYGEGSTFTVVVRQGVSDANAIGELSIHDQNTVKRNQYESGFKAPEARILIVDDNEMNLEVECKLLAETELTIDKALSGMQALDFTQKYRYDTILMDHLMPEMDGIECFEKIRTQPGGMNRTSPVIVLTANAGSENRDLYNRSGFDDYLVKPVSGEMLENMLIKHIPEEKVKLSSRMMSMREDIKTSAGYSGKLPVIITASSMSDLPDALVKKLHIPIIPFNITTEEGQFKDGVQMGTDELIRYIDSGREAVSSPPTEEAYTDFFARVLRRTHHVIHISLTTSMSIEYDVASEAAKSFDNVTVINSECLSSATGILVLIAHKLAQQSMSVDEIVNELENVKQRLKCSFVIDNTDYMAQRGLISERVHKIAKSFNLHPCLKVENDRSGVGGVWMGNRKRVYKKYIARALPVDVIPDQDIAFITYADVPTETLYWIRDELQKVAYFEHIVFKQASAGISSNCGPGTFGILYFVKSNKSYNLASFFDVDEVTEEEKNADAAEEREAEAEGEVTTAEETATEEAVTEEAITVKTDKEVDEDIARELIHEKGSSGPEWYEQIEGIDSDAAIINSGSADAFKTVLKIFYDSIPAKSSEIEGFYSDGDISNYTIKVHALKSSAKLVGALDLSERAQLLENAGKEGNFGYIDSHHEAMMREYLGYRDILAKVFGDDKGAEGASDKPEASEEVIKDISERLLIAAKDMDLDTIEAVFEEVNGYSLSDEVKAKFEDLRMKSDNFDYDGMIEMLES
ncbi:MAG: DegV family EDD domain-containing protein [Lachnospiraceae bacterium]|nr:DegV family EDD domain-containing protein [Lachnospiraceae bacterium]